MSTYSKYNQIHQTRAPKRKRTIRVAGSGEDEGKWYRCWNCGFINNIDRNIVGDGEGISYTSTYVPFGYKDVQTVSGTDTMMDVSIDDDAEVVMMGSLVYASEAVAGCSFCGCKNYR